ncbi:MAG: hypothetical protein JW995_14040 [Melioribacteraceae bacterium]|nr:hypothetical protein [Melioribacteraceae bacterium]
MKSLSKYIEALRENVCAICVDSSEEGECTLTEKEVCAIEIYFSRILDIIHSDQADDIDLLTDRLRKEICEKCRASVGKDKCYLRDDANCALDRYFPLIVETVRKVDREVI